MTGPGAIRVPEGAPPDAGNAETASDGVPVERAEDGADAAPSACG